MVFLFHGWEKIAGGWPPDFEKNTWGAIGAENAFAKAKATDKSPGVQWLEGFGTHSWPSPGGNSSASAMLLGVLTRVAAIGLLIIQVGAIATVTWARGFSAVGGGFEYNVVLVLVCLAILLSGPGCCAVDNKLFRKKTPRPGNGTRDRQLARRASGARCPLARTSG